jgi:hypothetical protein
MKTISWLSFMTGKSLKVMMTITMVALLAACSDDSANLIGPDDDAAGKGKSGETGGYNITSSSPDGFVWTINIGTPKGTKDASHLLLQFQDCDGNYLTGSYVASVTVNGVAVPVLTSTGNTGCTVGNDNAFIKVEDISGKTHTVVVTLTKQAASGSINVKSGTACGEIVKLADRSDLCGVCRTETAWAAGSRYVTQGNWATYTPYAEGTVDLIAGQNFEAGSVSFSAVADGVVTISINFNEGWGLDVAQSEGVKIQGYSVEPSGNPAPGSFTSYKGNSLVVSVPAANFYGVHVDTAYTGSELPCE